MPAVRKTGKSKKIVRVARKVIMVEAPARQKRSNWVERIQQPVSVGESIGSKIGGHIGGLAHYAFNLLSGKGDYQVGVKPNVNSLFKGSAKLPYEAGNISFGENSFRIKHREFLGDVVSSPTANTFQSINYILNPGLANTFPFISQIASSFQTYRFHGLVVEYKSTSADSLSSTNTALGSVVLATDYSAQSIDEPFISKQEMLNYQGSVQCKPSQNALMGIECDPRQMPISRLYVRTGADPTGSDRRLSDIASFAVSTSGMQATSVQVGELYLITDIEFFMKKEILVGALDLYARYTLQNSSILNSQIGITTTGLLGANSTIALTSGNLLFDNYNPVSGGNYATLAISDHTFLQNGMVLQIDYEVTGASVASLAAPLLVAYAGTSTESISKVYHNPNGPLTGFSVTFSWNVLIVNVNLLNTVGLVGKYTLANGYPNARNIFALQNNAGSVQSVPPTVTKAMITIQTVNPKMFNG